MTNATFERIANLRTYFTNDLPAWTVLHRAGFEDRKYAHTGRFVRNEAGAVTHAKLLNMEAGSIYSVRLEDAASDDWAVALDGSGSPETVPALVQELTSNFLYASETRDHLQRTVGRMESDWELLNEHLIREAHQRDWCSEYDNLVEKWNGEFQTCQLKARQSDYEVQVTVTATWNLTIRVDDMDDADSARSHVEDMSPFEMIEAAGDSIRTPDSTDYEIDSVDDAS